MKKKKRWHTHVPSPALSSYGGSDLVKCLECGAVYLRPTPDVVARIVLSCVLGAVLAGFACSGDMSHGGIGTSPSGPTADDEQLNVSQQPDASPDAQEADYIGAALVKYL